MKVRRHHLMRPLVIAAAVGSVAAPAARAADQDLGPEQAGRPGSGRVTPRVTIVEPSAFDWGDAGVGAAGALGLILLAGGVVIVSRHSHRVTAERGRRGVAGCRRGL